MLLYGKGSPAEDFSEPDLKEALYEALGSLGGRERVLVIPPDFTRCHSQAGPLTKMAWEYYGKSLTDILPAIGTHYPMTPDEIGGMFRGVPMELFRRHDWRKGISTLGTVPSDFVRKVSEGMVDYGIPIQVDRLIAQGKHDLILSIGQVVPHEVVGMANYNKNVFVGTGGAEGINKTHFLGAAYGMERIMGRAATPVRSVLNYGSDNFAAGIPMVYILTVVARGGDGKLAVRGLYIGDDIECFNAAAALSLRVNFELLEKPLKKVVVYLDPSEFRSTWLGNKSIYRTRMAIADGGELIVLAPGLSQFGEDPTIDKLVRKYGYAGTPEILELVKKNEDLRRNLGAAAHLIHGSSEGRFTVTYCPGKITRGEIEGVKFRHAELADMIRLYDPAKLKDGFNALPGGEEIFYISNPALGLWAHKNRFS